MKRVFSSLAAFALLAGLAVLAVLARPGDASTAIATNPLPAVVASAPQVQAAAPAAAPAGTNVYNDIALPLDAQSQFNSLGYTYNADGLASFIGRSSVKQVLKWNTAVTPPRFELWIPNPTTPGQGNGTQNFSLATGGAYLILVDNNVPTALSFVGDVPPQTGQAGAVQYNLVGTKPNCTYNMLSVPLDRATITNAQGLATALGGSTNVAQILDWDPTFTPPRFRLYLPAANGPDNFSVKIGYPYFVCMSNNLTWPTN